MLCPHIGLSSKYRKAFAFNARACSPCDVKVWPYLTCSLRTSSLYEQTSVVDEWEDFLEGIVSVPRPPPTERNLGLAVDASDFPTKLSWCRFVLALRPTIEPFPDQEYKTRLLMPENLSKGFGRIDA